MRVCMSGRASETVAEAEREDETVVVVVATGSAGSE